MLLYPLEQGRDMAESDPKMTNQDGKTVVTSANEVQLPC
jgi:hypothetical protein